MHLIFRKDDVDAFCCLIYSKTQSKLTISVFCLTMYIHVLVHVIVQCLGFFPFSYSYFSFALDKGTKQIVILSTNHKKSVYGCIENHAFLRFLEDGYALSAMVEWMYRESLLIFKNSMLSINTSNAMN